MIRFLGVIVGSALAVAALVVFVGIPEFTTESIVPEPGVITLPMKAGTPVAVSAVAEPSQQAPTTNDATAKPAPHAVPADVPANESADESADETADETAVAAADTPAVEPAETLHWYAFWSPFRSEVAANGFVDQLQRVTGLDYRVVKVKPGVYEVAFAYQEDQDITAKLSQISAATGLQLPES
jgi:hypothetical protein